jgi:pimeloyl-ACP methyl ester carboxylesterase
VAVPDTRYVVAPDGVHLAYQVVGDGPVDVAFGFHYFGSNVDLIWDEPDWRPFLVGFSEVARLILHDRRGLGVSSRNVPPPNLETQMADLRTVLDAAGSDSPILASGSLSSAVHVLFAATHPDRTGGLIWNNPKARAAWAPDYPWGSTPEEVDRDLELRAESWGTFADARSIAEMRARERLGLSPDGHCRRDPARARECIRHLRRPCPGRSRRPGDRGGGRTDRAVDPGGHPYIGECEIIDGKVGGLTVTIGARVAAKAGRSEILITQTVRELIAGSGFGYRDGGEQLLKGVPGAWRLWAVLPRGQATSGYEAPAR